MVVNEQNPGPGVRGEFFAGKTGAVSQRAQSICEVLRYREDKLLSSLCICSVLLLNRETDRNHYTPSDDLLALTFNESGSPLS